MSVKSAEDAYCGLWILFNSVMLQTRCKDPSNPDLAEYGANCRDLGALWSMLLPSNRCSSFYLHTLVHHSGDFMEYCLQRKLTIGMLKNSGAERRHEIGRVPFKKALSGGGKAYQGTREYQNRSAYLTLRGLLIWQYGRDMLAEMEATARAKRFREYTESGQGQGMLVCIGPSHHRKGLDAGVGEGCHSQSHWRRFVYVMESWHEPRCESKRVVGEWREGERSGWEMRCEGGEGGVRGEESASVLATRRCRAQ